MIKAAQGCWTCKSRKIGCDKTQPSCNNCTRTKRACGGYACRLIWPDRSISGRKKLGNENIAASPVLVASTACDRHFINYTFEDVALAKENGSGRDILANILGRPACSLSFHQPITGQNAILLGYYEHVISPMISTTRMRNGFSTEMLPMALSSQGSSAAALCSAMLALSAFHHIGAEAALPYRSAAMCQLSNSLSSSNCTSPRDDLDAQLAACMMLSMSSVFDNKEGNWHVHLSGARKMIHQALVVQKREMPSNFLLTWFLYYDVLGGFTQPFRKDFAESEPLWFIQTSTSNASIIIGALGCSTETFEIIHRINRLRASNLYDTYQETEANIIKKRIELEISLIMLEQHLDPDEEITADTVRQEQILAKAELYRLAALFYLHRVCPMDGDSGKIATYLAQAFDILTRLESVSSPWPLFIIACESRTEDQRITILQKLDQMDKLRGIGNIQVTRKVIDMFWKQNDLRADGAASQRLDWWYLADCDVEVPWFV